MRNLIDARISELKAMSYEDLVCLAPYRDERVIVGNRKVTIAIWKDVVEGQKLRIVVQAYRPFILGFGRMDARGFLVDSSGKLTDLVGDEMYDFS